MEVVAYGGNCTKRTKVRAMLLRDLYMFLIDFMEVNRQALDAEKRVENFVGGHRLSRHDDNAPTICLLYTSPSPRDSR